VSQRLFCGCRDLRGKLWEQIRLNPPSGGGGEHQLRFTLIIQRWLHTHIKTTPMQLGVVEFAHFGNIVQAGLTSICPVLYVVRFNMAGLGAPGKSTGFIPNIQCPSQGSRYRSRPPPYIEHFTVLIL
jgi:hypothetical protein